MTLSIEALHAPRHRSQKSIPRTSSKADPLGVLAHDVRGPLANLSLILEGIELRNKCFGDARIEALLEKAARVIDRLDNMISATLERARATGDALAVVPEDVSVPDLVEQMAALNQPLARERGVRLHCLSAEPLVVRGDHQLLMQAVDNLLTNAIKHSPRGGLVVCQAMPEGGDVVIRVEDEGPGLTDADMAKVFRPFTTLSAKSDAPMASTGLGLSIVRQIARSHGGEVTVGRGRRGKGAAFIVRLPQARNDGMLHCSSKE